MRKFFMRFDILSVAIILAAVLTIWGTVYSIHSDVKSQETIRTYGHTVTQQSMTWGIGIDNWGINKIEIRR